MGSRRESDDKEVLIDGTLYNVEGFKHPGGSIIKFMTGHGDATEAVREFHGRSAKFEAYLKTLKSRPAPEVVLRARVNNGADKEELSRDFLRLRKDLEEEGFFT